MENCGSFRKSVLHLIACELIFGKKEVFFNRYQENPGTGCWWLTCVISATQEAEIRRIAV
jgi:hypothetical protein